MLVRDDSSDMRERIKNMSYADWKKEGFSKGALNYLKRTLKRRGLSESVGKSRRGLRRSKKKGLRETRRV
jgi:hypothetical protein